MARKTAANKLTRKVANRKAAKKKGRQSNNAKKRSLTKKNPSSPPAAAETSGFLGDAWTELTALALPGLAAYGGGKATGWIVYRMAKKKSKRFAKHAGPVGSLAFALGASYAAKRIEKLRPYEMPIVIGAWIAALQNFLTTYLPRYGWILSDYQLFDAMPSAQPQLQEEPVDEDELSAALEGYSRPYAEAFSPSPSSKRGLPANDEEDDFSDIPGLGDEGLNVGIFSGGLSN